MLTTSGPVSIKSLTKGGGAGPVGFGGTGTGGTGFGGMTVESVIFFNICVILAFVVGSSGCIVVVVVAVVVNGLEVVDVVALALTLLHNC